MSATVPLAILVNVVCDDVSTVTVEVAPVRSVAFRVMVVPFSFATVPLAPPPNPLAPAGGVPAVAAAAPVVTFDAFDPPRFDTTKAPTATITAVAAMAMIHDRHPDALRAGGGLPGGDPAGSAGIGGVHCGGSASIGSPASLDESTTTTIGAAVVRLLRVTG
jgi:hypothetical protein